MLKELNIIIFYNFAANLKFYYSNIKNNFSTDNKYLAVITNNGLWIKDVFEDRILMINASKIEENYIVNVYISEFDKNFQIIRNIKSKKIDVKNKKWLIYDAEIYKQNFRRI